MKILHIATDEKFLDHAIPVFEKVYPGKNIIFVFSENKRLVHVKLTPDRVEKISRFNSALNKPILPSKVYQQYDVVVFHSLSSVAHAELVNIPAGVPKIWLGWGYDYYSDILSDIPLCLGATQKIYDRLVSKKPSGKVVVLARALVDKLWRSDRKIRAIESMSLFSPVLPDEYKMVKDARVWRRFPEFSPWNYGTIEDNLIKGFEGESVSGDAVLVGNSATYTNNHAEAFDLLHRLHVNDRKVIAPLSYGDHALAKKLTEMGKNYFSENFEPLMDFIPIEGYVEIIKECGYVIMNHVRQQAVGNIVIMLYLGARVFVRQENPVYDFFKGSGVAISTVQELEERPELLNSPLTEEERAGNRAIVSDYWGREKAYERTRKLVEAAFAAKGAKSPALLTETNQ